MLLNHTFYHKIHPANNDWHHQVNKQKPAQLHIINQSNGNSIRW